MPVQARPGAALAVGMKSWPLCLAWKEADTGPWQTSCDMRPRLKPPDETVEADIPRKTQGDYALASAS